MPRVSLRGVTKRFGDVYAVRDLDLEVEDGEYFVFLGPSGCGKTTTLRLIAGLSEPDEGQILLGGRDVVGVSPEDRNIGLVFQHFELFPSMTVYENVAYSLTLQGLPENEIEKRVSQVLEFTGLTEIEDKYPEDLSAPELQRCSIGRALAKGSKLLLFDEPLGSLDPKTRERFRFVLRGMVKGRGFTAIHVTHDQSEAMAIADRIAVFRAGGILQIGTPRELYEKPASIFVANFVGESTFLEGVIETSGSPARIRLRGNLMIHASSSDLQPGSRAVLALRKENMSISRERSDLENPLPGRVSRAAFVGKLLRYTVELDNGDFIELKHPSRGTEMIPEGQDVFVGFSSRSLLVYGYPDNLSHELALR